MQGFSRLCVCGREGGWVSLFWSLFGDPFYSCYLRQHKVHAGLLVVYVWKLVRLAPGARRGT